MPRARIASPKKSSRLPKKSAASFSEEMPAPKVKKSSLRSAPASKKVVTAKSLLKKKVLRSKPEIKKTTLPIQATIPVIQNDVDTVAQQLEKMTEKSTRDSKTTMGTMQCFVYGGAVCLLGVVALGLFLGFIVLPPLFNHEVQQSAAPAVQTNQVAVQPSVQPTPSQQQFGFYGTLLSKEKDVLIIKELLSPLPLEKTAPQNPKTYVVRVTPETEYTYQKPRAEQDTTSPLFTPEKGTIDAIQTGMFIFISTFDDTNATETVKAAHVLYSEKSPFGQ